MNGLNAIIRAAGLCLAAVAGVLLLPVCALAADHSKTFDLAGFDGISAAEGIHVIVDVGPAFSVVAESDAPRQLERLELEVWRGTLRAEMSQRPFSFVRTKGWKVTVRVSMPELSHAVASSGADIVADEMSGNEVDLTASSGAEIAVTAVDSERVAVTASSGSNISAERGSCDALEAVASSGSSVRIEGVKCRSVEATGSSGAAIRVFAEERIDANASSGASIEVHGPHEEIAINTSSGGSIDFP